MRKNSLVEGEELELKPSWTNRALDGLAAFANIRGGTLIIGIEDNGRVIGATAADQEIQRLANLITSRLGIRPSIQVEEREGKPVIVIHVQPVRGLVSCNGRYLRRVGGTNIEIWNVGELLPPLTSESLRGPHSSVLRNPLLARAFYFAGLIERWGTGTTRIIAQCREQCLPDPEFESWQGGVLVTFLKDPFTPERLRKLGLNDRQIKAVMYVKEHGSISNREYQDIVGVSKRTASRDLETLVEYFVLEKIGHTGKGTRYVMRGHKGDKGAIKDKLT